MQTTRLDFAHAEGDRGMFLLRVDSPSGPRVGLLIHRNQLPIVQMRVFLRRRKRRVAEKLLNRAKVGAGVQKMRRKRMPQRVRRDAGAQRSRTNVGIEEPA